MRRGYRESWNVEKLETFTDSPYVTFMSSHSDVLLQVADFYAFCLNRHQMLAIKENRTDLTIGS